MAKLSVEEAANEGFLTIGEEGIVDVRHYCVVAISDSITSLIKYAEDRESYPTKMSNHGRFINNALNLETVFPGGEILPGIIWDFRRKLIEGSDPDTSVVMAYQFHDLDRNFDRINKRWAYAQFNDIKENKIEIKEADKCKLVNDRPLFVQNLLERSFLSFEKSCCGEKEYTGQIISDLGAKISTHRFMERI